MNSFARLYLARRGIKIVDEKMGKHDFSKWLMQQLEEGTDYYYKTIEPHMIELVRSEEEEGLPPSEKFKVILGLQLIYYTYKTRKK